MMSNTHSSAIITTPIEERQDGIECISMEQLRFLVHLVDQSDIVELEVTHGCTKVGLVLRKSRSLIGDAPSTGTRISTAETTNYETERERCTIMAPWVGFFQSGSRPKNKSLVEVGDTVKDGQLVAVIRSLGVSNEVESPVSGRIVEILVQNEQPIEYGQPLIVIEK